MKHLDLFSGIGGFALACKWLDIETIGFVEIDPFCQKVLSKNFPNISIVGDIRDVKEDTFPRPVDIITGGFPCQPFSNAGKRKGESDDRFLWPAMCNVIKEYKPTWVLGENVAGIISMAFHQVLSDLENIGYETQAFIIPACAVNALHRRDRIWFIAHSNGVRFPLPSRERSQQYTNILGKNIGERELQERRFIEYRQGKSEYNFKSILCRNNDGIPNRVDRIKTLGNAIVPQVAYQILKYIYDIETTQ